MWIGIQDYLYWQGLDAFWRMKIGFIIEESGRGGGGV